VALNITGNVTITDSPSLSSSDNPFESPSESPTAMPTTLSPSVSPTISPTAQCIFPGHKFVGGKKARKGKARKVGSVLEC